MGWITWTIIGFVAALIIFILIRMDRSILHGENGGGFVGTIRKMADACCLGNIYKRK